MHVVSILQYTKNNGKLKQPPSSPPQLQLLNKFFTEANGTEYLEDAPLVGVHIATRDTKQLTRATSAPVQNFAASPFIGATVDEICEFAKRNFDSSSIVPETIVILDGATLRDSSTCLLVTPKALSETPGEVRVVRVDFASSLALANGLSFGCLGEEQIDDDLGDDGVVRWPPREESSQAITP